MDEKVLEQITQELARRDIIIRSCSMCSVAEEAPLAYKDVHSIALAAEKAHLSHRVALLKPMVCVKG